MEVYFVHLQFIFERINFSGESGSSVNSLIENITSAKEIFQTPLKEDIFSLMLADYIREIWISESPPQGNNIDTVEIVEFNRE